MNTNINTNNFSISKNYKINKYILYGLLAAFVLITSVKAALSGGDFHVFLDAALKLKNGQNIYAAPFIKGLHYFYSVFFAFVLIPFSEHVFWAEVLWSILSYWFLYRTYVLVKGYFDFEYLNQTKKNIWTLSLIFLSIQSMIYNFSMIQVTFFLLWAIFESLHLITKQKQFIGGGLLGLVINIKIMPVLILPYLFYRGYFKAVFASLLAVVALLFLPSLFIGFEYNSFLLGEWWKEINPSNKEHLFEDGIGTHSLVALIPVYLTETVGEMNFSRNFLNLSHATVEVVINISRLFLLLISLFYLRFSIFKKEYCKLNVFWEFSYFVAIIPLIMPHQQKYAFAFILPLISYLVYFFLVSYEFEKNIKYKMSFSIFVLCMLFFSPIYGSDVLGKFLFRLTQHYRLLTISTLLIIPLSIYLSPNKLNSILKRNVTKSKL